MGKRLPLLRVTEARLEEQDLTTVEGRYYAAGRLTGVRRLLPCHGQPTTTSVDQCNACPNCRARSLLAFALRGDHWDYAALNQLLALCGQPVVTPDFYASFFPTTATDPELLRGIVQFRAYALLGYGSFQIAFRELGAMDEAAIARRLGRHGEDPDALRRRFTEPPRQDPPIDRSALPYEDRWLIGKVSFSAIQRDAYTAHALGLMHGQPYTGRANEEANTRTRKEWLEGVGVGPATCPLDEVDERVRRVEAIRVKQDEIDRIARRHAVGYLVASDIDVYVATSMREPWEFLAMKDVANIFATSPLSQLAPVWFDPTNADSQYRNDKGLLEGLMLDRARATLYLAQEGDTLGKDSELAATLAHGKPVVVYIPQYDDDPTPLVEQLKASPLRRTFKRLLALVAEGVIPKEEAKAALMLYARAYEPIFELPEVDHEYDARFRERFSERLRDVYDIVAKGESYAYNRRADILLKFHPLAMQLDIHTGVTAGVLVARTIPQAASLLAQVLTNDLLFEIEEDEKGDGTTLYQTGPGAPRAPYRFVTNDRILTNSFWSYFGREGTPAS